MTTTSRVSLALSAVLALSGCGLSQDDFCKQLITAFAANSATCQGGSQAVYEKQFTQFFVCDDLKKAVTAKRMTYDGAKAGDCITAVKNAACGSNVGEPDACKAAMTGAVAVGGSCYGGGFDCASGSTCKFTNNACPGTCSALLQEGADCSAAGSDCDSGLTCSSTTKKCTALAKEGATCDYTTGTMCASGLNCVTSGTTSAGTCKAPSPTAACHYSYDCGPKYTCVGGGPTSTGTCTALKALGDACTAGKNECQNTLYCDAATSKCTEWPSMGASCDPGTTGENISCADGYCDSSGTKKCTAFKAAGATCTKYSDECGATFCGDGTCPARCAEI